MTPFNNAAFLAAAQQFAAAQGAAAIEDANGLLTARGDRDICGVTCGDGDWIAEFYPHVMHVADAKPLAELFIAAINSPLPALAQAAAARVAELEEKVSQMAATNAKLCQKLAAQGNAVAKFLNGSWPGSCQEHRAELAAAFGLFDHRQCGMSPKEPPTSDAAESGERAIETGAGR